MAIMSVVLIVAGVFMFPIVGLVLKIRSMKKYIEGREYDNSRSIDND